MDNRSEVREFLVTRRARLSPERAGVEAIGTRRRVAGLRREEVARLAGVSVDYYTRLERGALGGVSDSVLDALSRALQLDDAEREHLHDLARHANPSPRRAPRPVVPSVRPELQWLLDAVTDAPATIVNNRMDVVAANALGRALYSDLFRAGGPGSVSGAGDGPASSRLPNHTRYLFLDPRSHDFYTEWERAAHTNVAILRREAGRSPHDPGLAALVGELSVQSEEFRTRWAAHDVRRHYAGVKRFRHAVVGVVELSFQTLELDGDPGLTLNLFPAEPGSPTAERLRLLASWAATEGLAEPAGGPAAATRAGGGGAGAGTSATAPSGHSPSA